jgi:hypothetical protein
MSTTSGTKRKLQPVPPIALPTWPLKFNMENDPTDVDTALSLLGNAKSKNLRTADRFDVFPSEPHADFHNDDDIRRFGDKVLKTGRKIGAIVNPGWESTGGGSALTMDGRKAMTAQYKRTLKVIEIWRKQGAKADGDIIRLDSAAGGQESAADAEEESRFLAATFDQLNLIGAEAGAVNVIEPEKGMRRLRTPKELRMLKKFMKTKVWWQLDYSHFLTEARMGGLDQQPLIKGEKPTFEQVLTVFKKLAKEFGPDVLNIHVAQCLLLLKEVTAGHDITGGHELPFVDGGFVNFKAYIQALWPHLPENPPVEISICWDGCGWKKQIAQQQNVWNDVMDAMDETIVGIEELQQAA